MVLESESPSPRRFLTGKLLKLVQAEEEAKRT